MRREQAVRKASGRSRRSLEILPLDARDPDSVRAKALAERRRLPVRHRAA